jgi:hypothetical protein
MIGTYMNHESFNVPKSTRPEEGDFEIRNANDSVEGESPMEPISKREAWNFDEATLAYHERLNGLRRDQQELEDMLLMIHEDESIADRFTEDQIQELFDTRESLQEKLLVGSANYPGDWTGLLLARMRDPISKQKFIEQRMEALPGLKEGAVPAQHQGGKYEKGYQVHYQSQVDEYDQRLEHIFASTGIGKASEFGKTPRNLGQNSINQPGIMFTDATHKGVPLSSRQMNIVEAHEKGHGLRDFTSSIDRQELRAVIDPELLMELTEEYQELERTGLKEGRFRGSYVEHPDEIVERMAQFKNYFGMGATDTFTKKHLDYIREHYIADTGLDNGITDLLRCVSPKTEASFLAVINKYPI